MVKIYFIMNARIAITAKKFNGKQAYVRSSIYGICAVCILSLFPDMLFSFKNSVDSTWKSKQSDEKQKHEQMFHFDFIQRISFQIKHRTLFLL